VVTGLLMCTLMLPAAVVREARTCIALLIASCLSFGLHESNLWAITLTLAGPEAAGKWVGMQNGIGNLLGATAPLLTGIIVSKTHSFLLAFVMVFAVLLIGIFSYLVLVGKVEPATWPRRREVNDVA
jgi:MFS transporter, ACS family, D-galactonate transporter